MVHYFLDMLYCNE